MSNDSLNNRDPREEPSGAKALRATLYLLLGGVICQAMMFGFELVDARAQGREQADEILKMQWELAGKLEKATSEDQYDIVFGGRHNVAKCSTGVYGDLRAADPDWNSVSGFWSIVSGKRNTVSADRGVLIGGSGHTVDTDDQVIIADAEGVILNEVNPRLSEALRNWSWR